MIPRSWDLGEVARTLKGIGRERWAMATTRTFTDGVTVVVRGTPNPRTEYEYAAVLDFQGPFPGLLRRGAEAAAKEVLATRRAASWSWLDDGTLAIEFTRGDAEVAARVVDAVLDSFGEQLEAVRGDADDPAFDDALASLAD